ncbi:hypothetical protein IFM89_026207 [Coptis chinensis]|uniref:DNA-directed DNA polymerase family A palm domain-containing protein n=1 Tax=Coptis chinensis TaxID=261450 RepID=A0A835ID10_9MAGN|nr:hypothetical protein IFM89_026207 [Coptis chinensis]
MVLEGSAQRRIQLGVAKKIKNGARRIVLDKAEEARVAAFSAFKSLGLEVPLFSRPLLSMITDNPVVPGAWASSGEGSTSNFVGTEFKEFPAKPDAEDRKMDADNAAPQPEAKLKKVQEYGLEPSRELESITALRCTSGAEKLEVTLGNVGKSGCDDIAYSSIPLSSQLGTGGNFRALVGLSREHIQKEGDDGGLACQNSNENIYEQGPRNASSTPGGFDSFLDLWDTVQEFYFDIHFTKRSELNPIVPFEIHGMAICWEKSPVYYVNLSKDLVSSNKQNIETNEDFPRSTIGDSCKGVPTDHWWESAKHRWIRISKIMARSNVRKISWNLKVQIQVLKSPGISIQRFGSFRSSQKNMGIELIDASYFLLPPIYVPNGIDMCIVAWLLWPDEERSFSPNLEKEVKKRLSSEVAASANHSGRWKNQMRRAAHNGCCRRVAQTRALGSVLWKLVSSEKLVDALVSIENPLVNVLADMEIWGIGVDMEGCLKARNILVKKIKQLEQDAYKLAGMTFSLYTSADIANVLFRHLNLPIPEGQTKGKQHPSTDKHSLDLLRHQHPIVNIIKEHRTLAKLLNSTLGSICSQARLSMSTQRYTLHGHWLQTSTATGRLSMEEPNLQENWLLLTADYSQIELRLMAHFSKDSPLIELLSEPSGDVFTMISARWTGKHESAVSSKEREQTKRLVYGILYGMGPNTLAEQICCSSDEAAEKIRSFKSSFPGVASWLNEAVAICRQKGTLFRTYIETLMGRKRFLSKIKFGNNKEKGKAQRQAVNSICQGSAADIIKIAMINIHSVIVDECEKSDATLKYGNQFSMLKGRCRLLLQLGQLFSLIILGSKVHDELVLEVDPCLIREAGLLLRMSMENAVSLLVPLHAKLMVGKTWGSLETFVEEDYKEEMK